MQNNSDENVYVVITSVTDMDTGKSVEPDTSDEAKYAAAMQMYMGLVCEVGNVDEDPERPNGYIARNERVGLEIRFTVYRGAK